jgi:hypothetical protein
VNQPWTAKTIPPELTAILDAQAGKLHSPTGAVRSCLADILNRYDDLRDDAACALAEEALAADAGCADLQRKQDIAIAEAAGV